MEDEASKQVIIIGAGPAGLATAAQLQQQGIAYKILEKGDHIANSWHHHYDRLHLHTVKDLSHLPDVPFPAGYPQYVPKKALIDYYEAYAKQFDIVPDFGQKVESIDKNQHGWKVSCASGNTYEGRAIVFCAGMNSVPFRPHFQYDEEFAGTILHSHDYQNPQAFKNKKVLVVGMGNSGAEIALDLCEQGVRTAISVRGPVNIVPREVLGNPTQITALKLAKLPYWLSDRLGLLVRWLTVGDLPKYGIQLPAISPARQLRETGQTPVIDLGTLDYIRSGAIKVFPKIDQFSQYGVLFSNGEEQAFDAVILATGFRTSLQDWLPNDPQFFDTKGLPKATVGQENFEGLFFLGYNNYAPGGGLGIIRKDVKPMVKQLTAYLSEL